MRKFLVAVFCILSVLTVFGADNKDRLLTVIFTNDGHGMAWKFDEPNNPGIGGLAARKTLVDQIGRAHV